MPPIPFLPLSFWLTTLPNTLLRFTAQSTVSSLVSLETYHISYCLIPRSLDLFWAPTSWLSKDDASSASPLPLESLTFLFFSIHNNFLVISTLLKILPETLPPCPSFIDHSLVVVKFSLCSSMKKGLKSGNSNRFYLLGLQNHCREWLKPQN